ncbi:MAG: PIN domain-containing protein [Candidatus Bathyarchaeia archaeon]
MYIVETEFLFGLRKNDKWNKQVSSIIELYKNRKLESLFSCASAFLEAGLVLQAHGLLADQIKDAIFLMKQKMAEANIAEVELNSDDILRLYELLRRHDIEYFDAMQAAVALGRNAILITNDRIFKNLGVKTLTFQELIEKTKNS